MYRPNTVPATRIDICRCAFTRRGTVMPRKLLLSATAAVLVVAAAAPRGIGAATARAGRLPGNVFVSPSGKDSHPGTQSAPVKTAPRAPQLLRAPKHNMA